MKLSELKIKNLKPGKGRRFIADGHGLYLAVMPTGEKYWYRREWKDNRERKWSLGHWPEVSLKQARELNYTMRCPQKDAPVILADVVRDWWAARCEPVLAPKTLKTKRYHLHTVMLPALGGRDMKALGPQDVLAFVRKVQADRGLNVAHRVKSVLSQVFRYAIASGLVDWDPTAQIAGALTPLPAPQHRSTVGTEDQARDVLRAIDAYGGNRLARVGLLLLAHTFVRPGEMLYVQWPELDLEGGEWRIPPERMKMRRPHIVPLSPQARALFVELRSMSAHPLWCFIAPGEEKPFTDGFFAYHLRRMGYGTGKMTPHAFRGMASTLLNEHGFRPDAIERQLAHAEPNAVRAAYDRAEHLDERRRMMDWWGEYVDGLLKK